MEPCYLSTPKTKYYSSYLFQNIVEIIFKFHLKFKL